MKQHKTTLKSYTIINSVDLVMYIEKLFDIPVSNIESRFDLALYMEIAMDLQVSWETLLQDYK